MSIVETKGTEVELRESEITTEKADNAPRIEPSVEGGIAAIRNDKQTAVRAVPCFPWSDPTKFISLRDTEGEEVALIVALSDLDLDSRRVLLDALAEASFVFEIVRIDSIDTEYEIRNWKVQTRQGPCTFQTKLSHWPRRLNDGEVLVRDVAGDLFYIERPETLDRKSRKLLWALAD